MHFIKKKKNTFIQDECVQYVGPYGEIPLASAVLHVEVCHQQKACNKHLGREQGLYLLFCLLEQCKSSH